MHTDSGGETTADARATGDATTSRDDATTLDDAMSLGDDAGVEASCPFIVASDYDQSCLAASDCIGVAEGDICLNRCSRTAAINVRSYPAYNDDRGPEVVVECGVNMDGASALPVLCCINRLCALGAACAPDAAM